MQKPPHSTSAFIRLAILILGVIWTAPSITWASGQTITIATGGKTGVYYPAGVAICKAVNKNRDKHDIHCKAISTSGSVENVNLLQNGKADLAIVQSDIQFYAVKGYGPFRKTGPAQDLRAVLTLYPEVFTVVARADAGIRTAADLKGKRVNIGNPGSGQRTAMDLVMHAKRWSKSDFAEAWELPSSEHAKALCDGKIDAFVFMAGHPNASIKKAADACDVVLINAADRAVKNLVKKYDYMIPAIIKGGTYKGTGWSTESFGVSATLLSSKNVRSTIVYEVVKAIFQDFIDFRFSHPVLANLKPDDMAQMQQTALIHQGAERYLKRMGYEPAVERVHRAPR